jgi:hypothetical protein
VGRDFLIERGRGRVGILTVVADAFIGCDSSPVEPPPPPGITLELIDATLFVGDTVRVRVSNATEQVLGVNFCEARLQLAVGGDWLSVPGLPEGVGCLAVLLHVAPSSDTVAQKFIRSDAEPGTYRIRAPISWPAINGDQFSVVSDEFLVRPR